MIGPWPAAGARPQRGEEKEGGVGLLTRDDRQELTNLLLQLPGVDDPDVRRGLLADLPPGLRNGISGANAPAVHVANILTAVDGPAWAPLPDGTWPVLTVIENAMALVPGARLGADLGSLHDRLRARALGAAPPATSPASPAAAAPRPDPNFHLDGPGMQQLQTALLGAYPSGDDLRQFVMLQLSENLATITGGDSLRKQTFDLMVWAQSRGRLADLVLAAAADRPADAALRALAARAALPPPTGEAARV